jgi:enamine deaminase RidA (YjgF/YER057c/UK114 family)
MACDVPAQDQENRNFILARFLRGSVADIRRSTPMSLFGAMNTAISGLNAQSNAFANISDNVANSQTVGYKRVDTSFVDYLTTSTPTTNDSGSVVGLPDYVNNVQGTITQTDNPLGLAIAGQGFFAVSQQTGDVNGLPTFNPQQYYTRAGDFQMDKNGYLVNSAGEFLNGWPVNPNTGEREHGTVTSEARRIFENLKLLLESVGSSLDRLVQVHAMIYDRIEYDVLNRLYRQYVPDAPPARTVMSVQIEAGFKVMLDVIAAA